MRTFNKTQMDATTTGAKRLVSRGVGAGVNLAPVGRIKKFLLKLKARRAGNEVADAGPIRTSGRAGAGAAKGTAKKVVGATAAPARRTTAKKSAKKSPAKKSLTKKSLTKKTPAKKTPAKKAGKKV